MALAATAVVCPAVLWAEDRPAVTHPRATSGDNVDPQWEQTLRVTVGPEKADVVGTGHHALQAAVDYIAGLGGGTVKILPGVYRLRNSINLRSKVRIVGSGKDSVLIKEPSASTRLWADSDWYDQEITLADASGFRLGDGVFLRAKNPFHKGTNVLKCTLVARSGNRFKLDRALRENFWLKGKATATTVFSLLRGEKISDVVIENLTLDGNKEHNAHISGNYAGCIFLQDCSRITIRGVTARNFNGDGISWQVCHDVVVENCHVHDNADLGLHPGSGSQRPVIRNNRIVNNDVGVYFCWGIKSGLAEGNVIEDSRSHGIELGRHDNENLIIKNIVRRSGKVGVLFRAAMGKDSAPHRNRLLQNRIEDSGAEDGIGVDVQGGTESVTISGNQIVETRSPAKRIGVRLGPKTRDIRLLDNRITGFAKPVADLSPKPVPGSTRR